MGRSYKTFVREDFQEALINLDWTAFYETNDPNVCWGIMDDIIRHTLNAMCPLRNFRVQEIREPWITDELLEEIKDKDNLLTIAKQTNLVEDWILARRERNRVGKLLKSAKADLVKEHQRALKGEPRKFWKLISTIVPGKKQTQGNINLVERVEGSDVEIEIEMKLKRVKYQIILMTFSPLLVRT